TPRRRAWLGRRRGRDLAPGAKGLGHAPCLGRTAARRERRSAVEDLGDAPHAGVGQVMGHGLEETPGRLGVSMHAEMGEGERAEEPAPHGPLVVRAIALDRPAAVVPLVSRVTGSQASATERREQMAGAGVDDLSLTLLRERAPGKGDGEDLVGPERLLVAVGRVDHVVAVAGARVPEALEPA